MEHWLFKEDMQCPECDYWFTTDEEYDAGLYEADHLEDEAIFNMTCPSCNKDFEVKTKAYYKFSTVAF